MSCNIVSRNSSNKKAAKILNRHLQRDITIRLHLCHLNNTTCSKHYDKHGFEMDNSRYEIKHSQGQVDSFAQEGNVLEVSYSQLDYRQEIVEEIWISHVY